MPDQAPTPGIVEPGTRECAQVTGVGPGQLDETLTAAILARRGVLRIEPTLLSVARSLNPLGDSSQHLRLNHRGNILDVSVNLAVNADQQARSLAHWVRDDLRHCITALGLTPGTVEISILTIEPIAVPA